VPVPPPRHIVQGVPNAVGRFGRWGFLRVDGPYDLGRAIDAYLARLTVPA